jgi:hypothetical protein
MSNGEKQCPAEAYEVLLAELTSVFSGISLEKDFGGFSCDQYLWAWVRSEGPVDSTKYSFTSFLGKIEISLLDGNVGACNFSGAITDHEQILRILNSFKGELQQGGEQDFESTIPDEIRAELTQEFTEEIVEITADYEEDPAEEDAAADHEGYLLSEEEDVSAEEEPKEEPEEDTVIPGEIDGEDLNAIKSEISEIFTEIAKDLEIYDTGSQGEQGFRCDGKSFSASCYRMDLDKYTVNIYFLGEGDTTNIIVNFDKSGEISTFNGFPNDNDFDSYAEEFLKLLKEFKAKSKAEYERVSY